MQERRVSESRYLKTSLMETIASAVERIVLPVDPNFEKDQTNDAENLTGAPSRSFREISVRKA